MEETRQQVAQIREMLAAGINLNANNGPPADVVRTEELPEANLVNRRRNPKHLAYNPTADDDSDEEDAMGY
ncbi:hypothetical protein OIU77_026392, partial [Salix suchowensis]